MPVDFGPIEQVTENGYQNGLYNRQLNKSVDPADVSQRAWSRRSMSCRSVPARG